MIRYDDGFFRTTLKEGRECEQFTLLYEDSDVNPASHLQERRYDERDVGDFCENRPS